MEDARIIRQGTIVGCKHEHTVDAGHGTVTVFRECVACGAMLSYYSGTDHFLDAAEAAAEPPCEY